MCTCHDPVTFGHLNFLCPVTAIPPWGYSGSLGCTPGCREQHAVPSTAIEAGCARSTQEEIAVPVLYLDMDGTVRKGKDEMGRFVNGPEDVQVFPEAVERMRAWKEGGGRIAAVSNQGGVALGLVRFEDASDAMAETQRQCDGLFDVISYCIHHPEASHPEMARCWCRKPSAGAVVEAAHRLHQRFPREFYPPYMGLFVGDRPEDEQCAKSAGLDFTWAADWRAGS